ncbi:MAG: hypothetical protein SCARUB_05029 [Candidatus Scalindua rubra]|uniref:Lipoprotein n=1 Tax=Candidatus Scalindua rubra TaxID=1872076 RepID=A0A1E3X2K2_9BACT|nr:MAG: hypothetical protein SCARUB_05029 [Candidatus Scalindua rubra]
MPTRQKQATCLFMILWVTILLVSCVKTGQTRFHKIKRPTKTKIKLL